MLEEADELLSDFSKEDVILLPLLLQSSHLGLLHYALLNISIGLTLFLLALLSQALLVILELSVGSLEALDLGYLLLGFLGEFLNTKF